MDYKIVERQAFKAAGKGKRIATKDGVNFKQVPQFWEECCADGTYEKLCGMAGETGIYGICMDFDEQMEQLTYMIAVAEPAGEIPKGLTVATIPAATWAVFTSTGPMPAAIQEVWPRIFSEWFPATGYIHDEAPELEVYPAGDTSAADYKCEIWIPVRKK